MKTLCLIGFAATIVLLIALVLALLPSVRDVTMAVVMMSAFIALIADALIKRRNHRPQH